MSAATPPPLPIPVRPNPGERYTAYLHRLALANHLRPSVLRAYVNADAHAAHSFQLDRLTAISGRTPEALQRALTEMPSPHSPASPSSRYKKRKPAITPEARCAHDLLLAEDEVRYLDELDLYAAIRADAQIVGMTQPKLASIHFVAQDLVRDILHGRQPRPPGPVRRYKPAPTLEPVKTLIIDMWKQGISADRIWSDLVDNHQAAISKTTLKLYLRALRRAATLRSTTITPPLQSQMTTSA